MRHRKHKKTLDRKKSPREAMLRNLATSLVLYERVRTTKAKARSVAPLVERSITVAKSGSLQARRDLLRYFYDKNAVRKLMEIFSSRFASRHGGYTRTVLLAPRQGDGAEMVLLEILEK